MSFLLAQKALIDRNSDKKGGVTSYGFINKDKAHVYLHQSCLGSLSSNTQGGVGPKDAFFIWNLRDPQEKGPNDYLDYITSPEKSPWRELIQGQARQDKEFIHEYGFVLDKLDYPSNYVVNFLTAFRFPWEYRKGNFLLWEKLWQDGVSFGTSVALCDMAGSYNAATGFDPSSIHLMGASKGHYAFTVHHQSGLELIDRVNTGEPDKSQFSKNIFKTNTSYLPCNVIWGKGFESPQNRIQKWYRTLKAGPKKATRERMFSEPYHGQENQIVMSYPEVLLFAQALDRKEV